MSEVLTRTKPPINTEAEEVKIALMKEAMMNPIAVQRELNNRSFYEFLQYFWPEISPHDFIGNWHVEYLCSELEAVAECRAAKKPKLYDLIINIPPGTTKSITCSIMFPAWCWTKWPWMRFICASYSLTLSLEAADYCRDLLRSTRFQEMYPEIGIKDDKDTKSNFKIVKKVPGSIGRVPKVIIGGGRFSTSVGGTLMGFHGDINIVDDPLDPQRAVSEIELATANFWMDQTLPSRKTDKEATPTILIMQRLHQDDPSGHLLQQKGLNIKHICLPGEITNFRDKVKPPELIEFYVNDLLDVKRLSWSALAEFEARGQYVYAGQMGQDPTPPGGGMFKVDHFTILNQNQYPSQDILATVRYWDKAATSTKEKGGMNSCYTTGVKLSLLTNGRYLVEDVRRGRWSTNEREDIIRSTAIADGTFVEIWEEQEPGSGGKESAEATIRNLAGFVCKAERPTGDKVFRADPYSVQVNNNSFYLLSGEWNSAFIDEHRFFPFGTYKDQVDATSGAFSKLVGLKICEVIR